MTREKGQYFPYFYGISGEGLKEKNFPLGNFRNEKNAAIGLVKFLKKHTFVPREGEKAFLIKRGKADLNSERENREIGEVTKRIKLFRAPVSIIING